MLKANVVKRTLYRSIIKATWFNYGSDWNGIVACLGFLEQSFGQNIFKHLLCGTFLNIYSERL